MSTPPHGLPAPQAPGSQCPLCVWQHGLVRSCLLSRGPGQTLGGALGWKG